MPLIQVMLDTVVGKEETVLIGTEQIIKIDSYGEGKEYSRIFFSDRTSLSVKASNLEILQMERQTLCQVQESVFDLELNRKVPAFGGKTVELEDEE